MQNKKYLLIARGSSHVRYFKKFAEATSLDVAVIKINKKLFLPAYWTYFTLAKRADLARLMAPHFLKKARKHPRLADSFLWRPYQVLSRFLVKLDIAKSAALIDKANADVVGVWNGQKQPSSSIAEAANVLGKEVVYFENGLLPNSTTCDWRGVNDNNSLPRDASFYRQFDSETALPTSLIARNPIASKATGIELDALPEKFIFVPFQVETDSQVISNSPWIRSMGQLYQHLANIIDKISDPDLNIVIKEHPSDPIRHDDLHHQHHRIFFANQCNTQTLIERAKVVLTINSTVGIESLLLGKPVLVLGNACYGIEGVCSRVSSEAQLLSMIDDLAQCDGCNEIRRGFLNFMYTHYVIPTAWASADSKHIEALTQRLSKTDMFSQLIEQRQQK